MLLNTGIALVLAMPDVLIEYHKFKIPALAELHTPPPTRLDLIDGLAQERHSSALPDPHVRIRDGPPRKSALDLLHAGIAHQGMVVGGTAMSGHQFLMRLTEHPRLFGHAAIPGCLTKFSGSPHRLVFAVRVGAPVMLEIRSRFLWACRLNQERDLEHAAA